jgi:hypothetical protein
LRTVPSPSNDVGSVDPFFSVDRRFLGGATGGDRLLPLSNIRGSRLIVEFI